jgi:putative membrane-bound dehydrogenase-like protein
MAIVNITRWGAGLVAIGWLGFLPSALKAQTNASTNAALVPARAGNTVPAGKFIVKPGFRVELVASAPLLESPAAITFDEEGRLYVVENEGLRPNSPGVTRGGRVRRLDDRDAAGTYQASVILAENLSWPAGLAFSQGGLYVAATPEILYLSDVKKGGPAVNQRVVFQNVGGSAQPLDSRQLVRNLTWGPDNRIHGLTSHRGFPGGATPTALPPGHDFSFNPGNPTLTSEPGGANSGLAFDNAGTRFMSSLDRPVQKTLYQDGYLGRNPFFPPAPAMQDVAVAVSVFRPIAAPTGGSPVRPASQAELASTWMTNATGLTVYRGHAYPTNYVENVFVADAVAGVVHRFILRDTGLMTLADRAPDEAASEFLSSYDPSFHPVQVVNGPEGVLYIVDIGGGNNGGGIYRVVPDNFRPPEKLNLAQATIVELAVQLAHSDGWHRDTAARLLCERGGAEGRRVVAGILHQAKSPLARFHALMVLNATAGLAETNVLRALRDTEPAIRQQGIRLAENFMPNGVVSDNLWAALSALVNDNSIVVRHQLALSLGGVQRPSRLALLSRLLRRDLRDPWIQTAVLASIPEGAGLVLAGLAQDAAFRNDAVGAAFLVKMAAMIGVRGQALEVSQTLDLLAGNSLDQNTTFRLAQALGEGLRQAGSSLGLADSGGRLAAVFTRAAAAALNETLSDLLRANAVGVLQFAPLGFNESGDLLLLLLGTGQPARVQAAALSSLAGYSNERLGTNVVARLSVLGPALRRDAIAALLLREERIAWTVDAAKRGLISWADFPVESVQFLRTHGNPAVSGAAMQLFGALAPRGAAIQRFLPALRLSNTPGRGRDIFRARCAECHRLGGEGEEVGPDLGGAKVVGRERLLFAVIEPGAYLRPGYQTQVLRTRTGETYLGLLENPNSLTVTLVSAGGVRRVFPRANLESIQAQPWSLMPEGLESGLQPQDLANLLGYLLTAPR